MGEGESLSAARREAAAGDYRVSQSPDWLGSAVREGFTASVGQTGNADDCVWG